MVAFYSWLLKEGKIEPNNGKKEYEGRKVERDHERYRFDSCRKYDTISIKMLTISNYVMPILGL